MRVYLSHLARSYAYNTGLIATKILNQFLLWVEARHRRPLPEVLSRHTIADWHDDLVIRGLERVTVNAYVRTVERFWEWAWDDESYGYAFPRPRRLKLRPVPAKVTLAPTWAQMDNVISHLVGPARRVAILLRFLGLRGGATRQLVWADVDLRRGLLVFRGELGKSLSEKAGRVVPMSTHLVGELAGWGRRDGPLVGDVRRETIRLHLTRAWQAAEVPESVWRHRPAHAFRKGFVTGLRRAGADVDAIEYLVGHSLGLRGVYTDAAGLPLRETVDLIPPIGGADEVAALDERRKEAGEG